MLKIKANMRLDKIKMKKEEAEVVEMIRDRLEIDLEVMIEEIDTKDQVETIRDIEVEEIIDKPIAEEAIQGEELIDIERDQIHHLVEVIHHRLRPLEHLGLPLDLHIVHHHHLDLKARVYL